MADLLQEWGYSLQANRKTIEGKQHPDRDAQFRYISSRVIAFQRTGQPTISVDTKKKEPLGKLKKPGRTYRKKGEPKKVNTHDFPDKKLGKAVPYGVYDLAYNEAGVSVGISRDTAEFAVDAIRRWWDRLGQRRYPRATRLLITADSGGSNSPRTRLWKWAVQQFANETGLTVELCHYPPGTSKWNKIEHRLFCHITRNWQGIPLETLEIVVNLIGATRTKEGLEVHAWLDATQYQEYQYHYESIVQFRLSRRKVVCEVILGLLTCPWACQVPMFRSHSPESVAAQIAAAIARPTSSVDAVPPMSRVRGPCSQTCSIARRIASWASW